MVHTLSGGKILPTLSQVLPPLDESSALPLYQQLQRALRGDLDNISQQGPATPDHVIRTKRVAQLGRDVALKVLPPELASDPDRMRRFVREAKAASALKHPNVAHIYEIGQSDGLHFIAMEYVEGETLRHRLTRPLAVREVLDNLLQGKCSKPVGDVKGLCQG
jgi:serine/threonine protein kinase